MPCPRARQRAWTARCKAHRILNATLNARMIDGFGRFNEADYRRSWLFFEQVDYIFPTEINGPLRMPATLASKPLFTVVQPRSSKTTIEY